MVVECKSVFSSPKNLESRTMKKKNAAIHISIGLAIVAAAAVGLYTFKEYEKPVRTSSKPGKKKYVKEQPAPSQPTAMSKEATYDLFG